MLCQGPDLSPKCPLPWFPRSVSPTAEQDGPHATASSRGGDHSCLLQSWGRAGERHTRVLCHPALPCPVAPGRGWGGWWSHSGRCNYCFQPGQMRGWAPCGGDFSSARKVLRLFTPVRARGVALPTPCCPPQHLALARACPGNPHLKGRGSETGVAPRMLAPPTPDTEPLALCSAIPCAPPQPELGPR